MIVLGVESSCDETAVAVVKDGTTMLSNVVSSQIKIHQPYGGVVPELASRHHLQNILPVMRSALEEAKISLAEIDGIAVTRGPGLIGSLLVGVQTAKSVAYVAKKPLIGVNHLEGHLFAHRLVETYRGAGARTIDAQHLALMVSGGNTALILVNGFGNYQWLGGTRDDAAGEAFDKVAKLLGLGYPGGPIVEERAKRGDAQAVSLPRGLLNSDDLDFSFSGLKTAVNQYVKQRASLTEQEIADLCASFQFAVCDVLVAKTMKAIRSTGVRQLVATGGVLANQTVRQALEKAMKDEGIGFEAPSIQLCTDNGAMIAVAGTERLLRGDRSGLDLNAEARLELC